MSQYILAKGYIYHHSNDRNIISMHTVPQKKANMYNRLELEIPDLNLNKKYRLIIEEV